VSKHRLADVHVDDNVLTLVAWINIQLGRGLRLTGIDVDRTAPKWPILFLNCEREVPVPPAEDPRKQFGWDSAPPGPNDDVLLGNNKMCDTIGLPDPDEDSSAPPADINYSHPSCWGDGPEG
jgi:hypothetical protein